MNATAGKILVAEDSLVVRTVVCDQLHDEGYETVEAADGSAALIVCAAERPDAILLDIEMPGLDGHQVLATLKADPELRDIPVVFLTGRTSTDDMVAGLRAGAHDYLKKPFEPAELIARVGGAVRVKRLQDELRIRNDQLDKLSRIDGLTGLYNRRHIDEQLQKGLNIARRHDQPLAVLMLDIDHFKLINDGHGHAVGDVVLRRFGECAQQAVRLGDMLARWGGEEFLLVMPATTPMQAMEAMQRVRQTLQQTSFEDLAPGLVVTFSAGVSECISTRDLEAAIARADAAMYEAKHAGRNRIVAGATAAGTPCEPVDLAA